MPDASEISRNLEIISARESFILPEPMKRESLTGQLEKALASVDAAISLTTSRQRLGQFQDQKSKICIDHALTAEAKIASDNAVLLLRGTEREDFLVEALTTQKASSLLSPSQDRPQNEGDSMSQTLARTNELVDTITREDDAEHAWDLIELMHRTSDLTNNVAQKTMRHLFTLTPEFEEEYQRQMQRFSLPDSGSQAEH